MNDCDRLFIDPLRKGTADSDCVLIDPFGKTLHTG